MAPLAIGLGLANLAPSLLKWFGGSDTSVKIIETAVDIAKAVTGTSTGEAALDSLKANPDLVLKYQEVILEHAYDFERLQLEATKAVNTTMQAEAASDHWPTYGWRPFIGFQFGLYIMAQWLLPLLGTEAPKIDSELMIAVGGILGIASWFRGKAQSTPAIPTDNRG